MGSADWQEQAGSDAKTTEGGRSLQFRVPVRVKMLGEEEGRCSAAIG